MQNVCKEKYAVYIQVAKFWPEITTSRDSSVGRASD